MRHQKSGRKLNRNSPHRKAMFRNMASSLFEHEIIKTTVPKAKELRRVAEPLITLAKEDSVAKWSPSCSTNSVRATLIARVVTCAFSSVVSGPETRRRWPMSNWSTVRGKRTALTPEKAPEMAEMHKQKARQCRAFLLPGFKQTGNERSVVGNVAELPCDAFSHGCCRKQGK